MFRPISHQREPAKTLGRTAALGEANLPGVARARNLREIVGDPGAASLGRYRHSSSRGTTRARSRGRAKLRVPCRGAGGTPTTPPRTTTHEPPDSPPHPPSHTSPDPPPRPCLVSAGSRVYGDDTRLRTQDRNSHGAADRIDVRERDRRSSPFSASRTGSPRCRTNATSRPASSTVLASRGHASTLRGWRAARADVRTGSTGRRTSPGRVRGS